MKMKEKCSSSSDLKPVIVKLGLALALSFAGFVYSRLSTRRPNKPSSDCGNDIEKETTFDREPPSLFGVALVSSNRHEDVFVVPEFDDLVKEFDSSDAFEREFEIDELCDTVRMLRERERILENQLLEFYGLKEQESTVVELRNRLKLNSMEAKVFSLKVESLRAENQKLEAKVVGDARMVEELEAARAKISLLKDKLRFEAEENKAKILNLKQRVEKFEAQSTDSDSRLKLKRAMELEIEIEGLKKSNSTMELENSELARKLESTQILAGSILEDPEDYKLKKENEDLKNEIEQLQSDRCSEIEELVYLRWINACLRYELRDYQPSDGKSKTGTARDLSKSLSPKSEEKAKQLILEYANTESEINLTDFDYDQCSSSQASFTDSAERDDSSSAKTNASSSGRKSFLNKLTKLVRGKDSDQCDEADLRRCSSSLSAGDYGSTLPRLSLDLPRSKTFKEGRVVKLESEQRNSDGVYKTFVLGSKAEDQISKSSDRDERSELLKYAEALKRSRRGSVNLHRKSASYGF